MFKKKFNFTFLFCTLTFLEVLGQCSLCAAGMESNVNNGKHLQEASNLNMAIIYLLAMPYLLIGIGIFFWYKNAKRRSQEKTEILEIK